MKLKILSDLHLDRNYPGEYFDPGSGEVLILAGDIIQANKFKTNGYYNDIYHKFFNLCSNNYKVVLYVMGNHEFYQYNIESTKKIILSNLPDNIYLLDNNTIQIDDVYFHGATLWTDFRKNDPLVMYEVKQKMNDYKCIRHTHNYKRIQPYDIYNIHQFSKEYIATKLAENKEKKNVVITHHAPCQLSIPERYKNEILLNHGFYSDLSDLILDANPNIWVHGHIHSNSNYTLGDTRVICNPKGSHNENPNFNLELCVEI